jgi:predicted nucleotide-binding protein (sugar kinase/HSP70/actin superfamily)
MDVAYTDRCLDTENNSAAMIVRVTTLEAAMENALQIKWNDEGKIIFFYNWYGQPATK